MNVRVALGRLTHLRRLLSHFVPGYPGIRRSSAFAGYQRRGRGRQSRACGTRHSCVCELSVRRRRASALCSPWHGCMARGRLFACDGAFRVSIGHHEVRARRIHATGAFEMASRATEWLEAASARDATLSSPSASSGTREAPSARDATLPVQSQGYVATLLHHPPATLSFALIKTSPHAGCGCHSHVTTFLLAG